MQPLQLIRLHPDEPVKIDWFGAGHDTELGIHGTTP
jgi:hypothetical protein